MKQYNDPHQASQSARIRRAILSKPQARLVNHNLLYAASVFFLLHSMNALGFVDRYIYGGPWNGKVTGDKFSQALNLLGIFTSLFLFWFGACKIRIARFNRLLPLTIASFVLISVLWSVDQRVTLSQGTQYFFVVLGAIGMVEALEGNVLMDLVALIAGLSAVASVVWPLIFPTPGDFIGIFTQKNVLGEVMAAGVLTALHGLRISSARKLRNICIIVLCTIVAFMSKSATSMMAIVVFFGLDMLGRVYLRGGTDRIISIILAMGCVLVLIFLVVSGDLLEFLGKDPTLTGRTLIWPHVIDAISEKPLLGWGFSAFWSPSNPTALQIAAAVKWYEGTGWILVVIPQAHNGLLELLLETGFLGTSYITFLWLRNLIIGVNCMNGPAKQNGLSLVLLLIGILVIGVSEEVLVSTSQIWTSLFFIMGFICEKKLWLAHATQKLAGNRGEALSKTRREARGG